MDRGAANDPLYRDREEGGHRLSGRLLAHRGQGAVVLGIPRGGVPVAAVIARALDAELDVVVARKLGAPGFRELAVGAVTSNGGQFLNDDVIAEMGVTNEYLQREIATQMEEAKRREELFRGTTGSASLKDRTVIVVDDGLATGATMRAAVRSVKRQGAGRVIVAVPVGSPQACDALRAEADEVVCLHEPEMFWAVGAYYEHFEPVEDEEVRRILQEARAQAPA